VLLKAHFWSAIKTKLGEETEALATLQMLLVSESGSEEMCLQSPMKNIQTIRSENIGG